MTTAGRRRALGQHFLRDAGIARRIVETAGLSLGDLCVEIGPGEGVLTFLLAERAGRLLALEVDEKLVEGLRSRLAALPHVEVRLADARSFDYSTLPAFRPSPEGRAVIVGNLPYSASKPILERLVAARTAVSEMVLTLQKEVAERVAAGPCSKRYGALSVLTQLYCDVRLALSIPPGAFRPPPQVDSAVLHLRVLAAPRVLVREEGGFHRLVKAAFSQRRKTLANALAGGLGVSVATARQWLAAAGIDPARRAETLSLQEFSRLNSFGPSNPDGKMKGLQR
ncbi:MAG: ribosomal RNA small subunit methyltransferase A [Candidatus Rokubacteria bacterium]|nr:ribosomal RNA small subunit methyltransferase A [Candidatus Rokubacteria bacterium]